MSETAHALFGASKAPRWTRCPGSIQLEGKVEKTSSKYADEGTAAHTLAALCLEEGQPAIAFAGRLLDAGERRFEVDEDMIENVQKYVDYCNALCALASVSWVEHCVDFSAAIGQPNSFGTADFIALIGTELVVVDLKYGMGVQVDAEENEQLMLYAIGALAELDLMYAIETVRLVIQQPRKHHLSEWATDVARLHAFAETASVRAYQACQPDAAAKFLVAGEKQCKFCPAKAICPALARDVLTTVVGASAEGFDDLTAETLSTPETVADEAYVAGADLTSNEALAVILPKLDMIEDWCQAIRDRARAELMSGREVPGYKLVAGKKGARSWSDPAEAETVMKSMRLKQDEMYDFSLISVTTAEKRLKDSPKRWARLSNLVTQKDGAPTLAPASDKRPALPVTKPADAFEPVPDASDLV
ncbi:DUF2800 domain-containing protein [Asticcacaulis sp.]|uniref:DUF2800 domain-containing protein n=1 Tax=Asticcacaulis sp. TaxID=1872648 RepID=UPI0031D2C5C4